MSRNNFIVNRDTIAACASAQGKGGVAIVRLSGDKSKQIAARITHKDETSIKPRNACFVNCYSDEAKIIDEALLIYFPAPHSFTGEEVVEIQCHGSPVVVDVLLSLAVNYGARLARAGEFSERAFLNNKIDLTQAEAIADLIDSQSRQAARQAVESLKGRFSQNINHINEALIETRCYVEAAIDFPDEEGVDFIAEGKIKQKINEIISQIKPVLKQADQALVYQQGLNIVIAGEPNAGKSSLLNALCQKETAIVTNQPGTTRDVLRENISIQGVPVRVIDTAGLRESNDVVEQEGIKRAWQEIKEADLIFYVYDGAQTQNPFEQNAWKTMQSKLLDENQAQNCLLIHNKIDLSRERAGKSQLNWKGKALDKIALSARQAEGVHLLEDWILQTAGVEQTAEQGFSARKRHVEALKQSLAYLDAALTQLEQASAFELLAEELRYAQQALEEITGVYRADELLGKIFSSFCIGK